MKKLFVVLGLLSIVSCGKVKVDDIEIKDSTHTIRHEFVLEGDVDSFSEVCAEQYPEDVIKEQDCVAGYMDALKAILDIEDSEILSELNL